MKRSNSDKIMFFLTEQYYNVYKSVESERSRRSIYGRDFLEAAVESFGTGKTLSLEIICV